MENPHRFQGFFPHGPTLEK